jgi:hypothetical protein
MRQAERDEGRVRRSQWLSLSRLLYRSVSEPRDHSHEHFIFLSLEVSSHCV